MTKGAAVAAKGRDVVVAERAVQAVRLRARGFSYRVIAKLLNSNRQSVFKDVADGLAAYREQIKDATEELAALELERLEMPVKKLARLIRDPNTEPDVFFRACETWRKLSESRRKLLGLDMPTKVAQVTPDGSEEYRGMSNERLAGHILGILESAALREKRPGEEGGANRPEKN